MGLVRFPVEKYASLELNQVAFPQNTLVVSQTPLGAEYTEGAPCENGMWVLADKSKGTIGSCVAATDKPIGIVYTSEKEYDYMHYGLKTFGRKIAGDYPRVGVLSLGDTMTSNCFQYDDSEAGFTTAEALEATLKAFATTPVYVVPVAGSSVPKLTKTKPTATSNIIPTYGKVTKYYTMPNGEKGIKYQIVNI